ncbi:hydrophobic/amphiphilic exporter-1, HAE1 family [Nonomuraea solani]|uniref:Hydrophobic/amphiphilic exporter-1, HAE1 family n=1 Tax=Nonomuraea solani TaxID=1144553 RepID=A0A1H6ET92_9ACTN|nr:efflux RND transporter permease subunit [Nonomuraea solani]SEG99924.1 hydrophobic/amphiphilic exporter-1, HAE1 family [Nonomuraea solani]
MSFLARLSLANRGLVALVTLAVTAFGIFTIPQLKQQLLPSLAFPQVSIIAAYPGAAPQIVEDGVTVPIEDAVRGLTGVTGVTSTSRESSSTIQVAFDFGTDVDAAQSDIQQAVDRLSLPDDVDPQVAVGSTDDLPVMQLAAASDEGQQGLADRLSTQVVPTLAGIEGVKEATVTGLRAEVITITPDEDELKDKGLDASAISSAIQNAGNPLPAGTLTKSGTALSVQVGSRFDGVADLKDLYLTPAAAPAQQPAQQTQQPGRPGAQPQQAKPAPKPDPVRLGDVASVKLGLADSATLTRTDGKPSLGISITMKPDGNAVSISDEVRAELPALARQLGGQSSLTIVFDQAPSVEQAIESLTTEGLLGLAMAVLIILVFLFSIRSTLVTAVSIPLSVLIALIALWAWDYSLNMLTLGALTIAVGRVVDDSIVVLENIKRHLSYGERKRQAIENGVREVAGAVTASTLTTVAVFLPIAFVGGLVGELFGSFSITVTVALLASLLVSLTVVPVLSYWFLKPGKKETGRDVAEERERRSPLQRAYVPVIRFATRHRLSTVAAALAILAGTLALIPRLETSFIDNAGQNTVSVTQNLPAGTSLTAADAKAKQVEDVLTGIKDIASYQVTVGGGSNVSMTGGGPPGAGGGGGGGTARASYSLTLRDGSETAAVENTLRERLGALTDAGEISVGQSGGFGGDGLQVVVHATEQEGLREAADTVRAAMASMPGLTEVTSSAADTAPRVDVTVDREKAAEKGLSEMAIGQAVAQAFQGATVTQLTFDDTTADVVLRTGDVPASLGELRDLELPGGVELRDVAKVAQVDGPVSVTRIDGQRSATVSGKYTGSDLGTAGTDLENRLAKLTLPAGATYSMGGASADQAEAFGSLGLALVAAVALVFFVMVGTFRSLIQPLILLVSIPFAATGAIGLLLVTGTPLGLAAMIGLLMLVGIVVTNAIVLLDLINQYRRQGMPLQEAVVEGGRKRLRPILMTALATIFALMPMALGLTGGGGFISKPLAIVVIGGLVSSTLLTLVLVPTLYTMVENRKEKRRSTPEAVEKPVPVGVS